MTTPDPRIEPLAQAAARHSEILPEMDYYRAAAQEFIAFDDALGEYYRNNAPQPPPPEPAYTIDVRAERARTAAVIKDHIGQALRLSRAKAHAGDETQAGGALAIAMELQAVLDDLA